MTKFLVYSDIYYVLNYYVEIEAL